jgi:N,N'-diacetyllegionaminate synthase
MRSFNLGGIAIGADARCFVIAEAGVNHDGDLAKAHRLVDAAADAGADAVKFQTFDPVALASADAPKADYQMRSTGRGESQRQMLQRLQLKEAAHVELQRHAIERRILFLSTPFEYSSAELLLRLRVPAFKVPSGELTNLPFLQLLARHGLPLLVSTGMSTLDEVADAVSAISAAGDPPIALFHCTSSYPAPLDATNLRAMETLRQRFAVPVGYSDHTLGVEIPIAAVALGAKLLEKHLTLDRTSPGPDHAASMEPNDFARMVQSVRAIEQALGDGDKRPQDCEMETRMVARKSLVAALDLEARHVLQATDLVAKRPGSGLSPSRLGSIVGRRLRRDIAADTLLSEEDLD